VIAELQVVPAPPGTGTNEWAHVDAAIAVVAGSGLRYEVGALGTTLEGPSGPLWATLRAAHEATLAAGADAVVTIIKLYETRDPATQPAISDLAGPHRLRGEAR
jgi:uncharacterized protein YqgV (UPF0045/DUF77 family)